MTTVEKSYQKYVQHLRKVQDIKSALALLHWDNEVNAPKKGAKLRGQQITTLAGLAHEYATDPSFGDLLLELHHQQSGLEEKQADNVRLSLEEYKKSVKLPTSFVRNFATAKTNAYQAWEAARAANNFELYKNALHVIVELLHQKVAYLGYEGHPYNALLDEYERGATVQQLDLLFENVRKELVPFTRNINNLNQASNNSFLHQHFDEDKQWQLGLDLLAQMGFDFEAGRQDRSTHPFTMTLSPTDVRVTTRIDVNNPMDMIGSCIHEGGHALYEMGLPTEQYGLPLGLATSLGIHESQSRLWENHVGLSKAYWEANLSHFKSYFPTELAEIDVDSFYKGINQVSPNFVRTTADELHYHLHVLVRYEIEKGLIENRYKVADLEDIWNQKYKLYLGIEVPNANQGILQDIHWAEGLFGYFPTYSLGSFYAAQFYAKAKQDIPLLEQQIAKGNCQSLLTWLRTNIHQHGQRYTSEELCQKATGEGLDLSFFMDYIREKYKEVYNLSI
ncbi:MAG: carboxypeptidase M32 [Aureispira sp.]